MQKFHRRLGPSRAEAFVAIMGMAAGGKFRSWQVLEPAWQTKLIRCGLLLSNLAAWAADTGRNWLSMHALPCLTLHRDIHKTGLNATSIFYKLEIVAAARG